LSQEDEVVIVNDGSTDDTCEVIKSLEEKHPCLRVINHVRNRGGAAARNTAVENARHDLIFCLDSDNLLVPGSVPKLRNYLLAENADAAVFRELHFFKESPEKPTHKWRYRQGEISFIDALSGAVFAGGSGNYLYTRASWIKAGGYPEFVRTLDTWGFGIRQVATGQRILVMEDGAYLHRYGHQSNWVRETKTTNRSMLALQILIPFLDRLSSKDVDYIMSRSARKTWFNDLDRRPLRAKTGEKGRAGEALTMEGKTLDGPKKAVFCRLKDRLQHILAQGR